MGRNNASLRLKFSSLRRHYVFTSFVAAGIILPLLTHAPVDAQMINLGINKDGHYLSPGIAGSFTLEKKSSSFAGGQLSYFYFWHRHLVYLGTIGDVLFDARTGGMKTMVGVEFGFLMFGVEGGVLLHAKGRDKSTGFMVRPLLNIPVPTGKNINGQAIYPVLSLFYAHNYAGKGHTYSEIGFLIKIPLFIAGNNEKK